MTDKDRYIAGVPCWADAAFPDPAAAADFYSGLFGWECEDTMPTEAPVTRSLSGLSRSGRCQMRCQTVY